MHLKPLNGVLGAFVEDVDLSSPMNADQQFLLEKWLGEHGVLCFRQQNITPVQLREFSARFGTLEINVANSFQEPGLPEVMILSNILENGKPIGFQDAGQSWHTDMSYSSTVAFTNVLYALQVPVRDGEPLGCTEFCNTQAAYEALPADIKNTLKDMHISHDFAKFWDMMRLQKNSSRPPLTEAQRRAKPPVIHPIFPVHPITGRRVLYANPGYSVRIVELSEADSDQMLDYLFKHQTEKRFHYRHRWQVKDVLMWDNIGTIHNAVADYNSNEHRLIKRCQVMADRFQELSV